ncbi:MAG: hypothetical protein PVI33_06840 [Candidatus Omnitrophota bacterium]|jgi:hypothetical protein
MAENTERVLGYILFCIGLICIAFALNSTYQIFTNVKAPPEIFQMESVVFSTSSQSNTYPVEVKILLDSSLRRVVNTLLYYLFMLFILAIGGKLSTLGIQLLRRIKVIVKDK